MGSKRLNKSQSRKVYFVGDQLLATLILNMFRNSGCFYEKWELKNTLSPSKKGNEQKLKGICLVKDKSNAQKSQLTLRKTENRGYGVSTHSNSGLLLGGKQCARIYLKELLKLAITFESVIFSHFAIITNIRLSTVEIKSITEGTCQNNNGIRS
ncbi:hypothetical protein BY458DRAFT_548165 [Sporodiniella umbellata]|nr:hypothetical protein BY458DRAFT_548165 [Sporodiniella umbellata]